MKFAIFYEIQRAFLYKDADEKSPFREVGGAMHIIPRLDYVSKLLQQLQLHL